MPAHSSGSPHPKGLSGREGAVLLLGAAMALALGWAGWLVGGAPDALAEVEVANTARSVASDVQASWDRFRSGYRFTSLSNGRMELLEAVGDLDVAILVPEEELADGGETQPLRASLALLLEAERLVVEEGAVESARVALDEAKAAGLEARDLATQRLVELRIAVAAHSEQGGGGGLEQAWTAFLADVDWSLFRGRLPIRLIGAWSALGELPQESRDGFRDELLKGGARFLLSGTAGDDSVVLTDGVPTLVLGPDLDAALQFTDQFFPGLAQELKETEIWWARTYRRLMWELRDHVAEAGREGWSLARYGDALVACRWRNSPFLVEESRLPKTVLRELERDDGFFVQLSDPGAPALGADASEPLLRGVELSGGGPPVDLFHESPGTLLRAAIRQRTLSGWLLAALGLLAFFGALGVVRMLRRERRLSELRNTFVAGVSHDLRSPLASILLMADNLKSKRVTGERVAAYASGIASEAERLRRRVDDVLDFARIDRGEAPKARVEDVRLADLVGEMHVELAASADRAGFAYQQRTFDLPAAAEIDADALRRIAGNLVENSLRHSGGSAVRVAFRCEGGTLELQVEDDGVGIAPAKRARVLRPFERLHDEVNPKGGTGLGLAIVASLVEAAGGDIALDHGCEETIHSDRPARGLRVTVRIPLGSAKTALA